MSRRTEDHPDLPPAEVTRLIAKFGTALMKDGFIAIPTLVKKYGRHAGLTPTEYFFWETVISFQYGEELPWPSVDRLADEMRKSRRMVERYIRRLEDKDLLKVERGEPNAFGISTNRYDFSPLYEKVIALDNEKNGTSHNGQNGEKYLTNNQLNRVSPPPASGGGDTFDTNLPQNSQKKSSKNGHQNGHLTTEMRTEMSAGMAPKEESNQEDSLQEERDSNLRSASAQNSKGTGLNSRSTSNTEEQQASSKDEKPKSNASYNNSNNEETKQTTKKRNNRNGASDEGAAAPPACSNVPIQPAGKEEPPYLPTYAANYLDDLSHQFGDMAPKSSQTRAAKIYAKLKPWEGIDEYFFVELITMARDDASKANITKTNPKNGKVNRMPYFLKVLDQLADYNIECWVKEQEGTAGQSKGGGGGQPGGIA